MKEYVTSYAHYSREGLVGERLFLAPNAKEALNDAWEKVDDPSVYVYDITNEEGDIVWTEGDSEEGLEDN